MKIHELRIRTKRGWHILRYADENEAYAVEAIMAWADDPDMAFSWVDAATMSWKVIDSAAGRFEDISDKITKMVGKVGE